MKRSLCGLLVLCAAFTLGVSAWASDADVTHHWQRAKHLLKEGDYQGALDSLEQILSLNPDDLLAQGYRSLCEQRLRDPRSIKQLSPSELSKLENRLRQEAQAQRKASSQQKIRERTFRIEQRQWDQKLSAQRRQAQQTQQTHAPPKQQSLPVTDKQQKESPPLESTLLQEQDKSVSEAALEEAVPDANETPPLETSTPVIESRQQKLEDVAASLPHQRDTASDRGHQDVPPGSRGQDVAPPTEQELESLPSRSEEESVGLKSDEQKEQDEEKVEIHADQMIVSPERKRATAQGDVELEYGSITMTCDRMTLFTDTHDLYAQGDVWIKDGQKIFQGQAMHTNTDTKKGRFLQGRLASLPWYESGRLIEQISEGVYRVHSGEFTSCDHEPPHFKFTARQATVFGDDSIVRARHASLRVGNMPVLYLPWLSVADRRSPFYIIPGKRKPWGEYTLMGYRYELPEQPGSLRQQGTLKVDWRRYFGWGVGWDHQIESDTLGSGLLKTYYNDEPNQREPKSAHPKGAEINRYRLLWRHLWRPREDTVVLTDIQEFSDVNFRKELLFQEEFVNDDQPESFISSVTSMSAYTFSGLLRKRMNRFQTVTEALPQMTVDVRPQRLGRSQFYTDSHLDFANFQTVRAHSDNDTDVVRVDWLQQLSYALNWFRPIEITPRAGIRQTYYTKDKQGGSERPDGMRNLISGQLSFGTDASLKLFRIFPVVTNWLGLDLFWLRHVLTPTISYQYTHQPTVPNSLLEFPTAGSPANTLTFGIENKLQTRRSDAGTSRHNVDLARFLVSLPYTFRGNANKQGGRLGNWAFDLEITPWRWMRLEADWSYRTIFPKGQSDSRVPGFNLDWVVTGGAGDRQLSVTQLPKLQAPEPGQFGVERLELTQMMPKGQWYLGLGHRYSHNDKTEAVLQWDWQATEKWQIGTFHRLTWKEAIGGSKRFYNFREYQYRLRRDLHDWIAELSYHVDREFGEELFFIMTLKAFPQMPLSLGDSYHQPKIGSQNDPFSPMRSQHPTPVN